MRTQKEQQAAWYKANTARLKEAASKRYYADPEKAKKQSKVWWENNKAKHRAFVKKWTKNNPGVVKTLNKAWRLKKVFWNVELYDATFEEQRGLCAICGLPSKIALAADHNHTTNTPRGLLCKACNVALGALKEDPKACEAAAAYLRKWGK